MELSFQTSPIRFLRCAVQEVRGQEETAEMIVPDSFPDIAAIADCCAVPILRGKDCRNGSMNVAGGVKGAILYTPDDETHTRRLDVYIPFSVKFEHPAITEHAQVLCSLRVCDVDARMINSRKAMLRVELACEITAYEQAEDQIYAMERACPQIPTKTAVYQVRLPLELAEKSFAVSETIDLSNGHPPVSQIYKLGCCPELTDQKVVGNKAVFKGILHCKFLYISENQELYFYQQQLPFSQYCDLQEDYDQEEVCVFPVITGCDLELDGNENNQRILLTVNLLAQSVIFGVKALTMIEDAYCTKGEFTPQWKRYAMENCLDRQVSVQTVRHHMPGKLREVLDSDIYWNYPICTRKNEQMEVSVPVKMRVLGYDDSGTLTVLRGTGAAVQNFALAPDSICRTVTAPMGEVHTTMTSDGVEMRCELSLNTDCYGGKNLQTLCGGSVQEDAAAHSRPSVILRTVPKDTTLWDLAKTYGSTDSAIRAANRLDAEQLAADTLLLIPVE